MAKPTERAIKRKPSAVVLLSWEKDKTKAPAGDRDFEWFDSPENRATFVDTMIAWNVNDVKDHGDLHHMVVEITDTATEPMTLGRVVGTPDDDENMKSWADKITKDMSLVFEAIDAVKSSGGHKQNVRAKKASPAAKKAVGGKDAAPKPKARKAVAKKATAVPDGEGAPAPKGAHVRKRIAAKKAPAKKASTAKKVPTPAKRAAPKKAADKSE